MSNLEAEPAELVCAEGPGAGIQVLDPREVPLGGPRAMTVRRTLPQRARSLIGAWCFVDHYGPDDVADAGPVICACHGVGLNTIRDALSTGAATDVASLGEQLRCGTNCGSCLPELKKIVVQTGQRKAHHDQHARQPAHTG